MTVDNEPNDWHQSPWALLGPRCFRTNLCEPFSRQSLPDTTRLHSPRPRHHLRTPLGQGRQLVVGHRGRPAPARPQRRVEDIQPPSRRAPAHHDRGRHRRNRRTDQPPGSLRRRHRHRATLPRTHHLRPARRSPRRLATVRPLDRPDFQSLQLSLHSRRRARGDAPGANSTTTSTTWSSDVAAP